MTISVTASSAGGTGSGVVLSSDGYVLTNTHVVTLDGASADGTIEVTTYDGKLYKAKVVGIDPIVDLAVIKLEGASGLQPISFADSSDLNVGDQAVAIGAPARTRQHRHRRHRQRPQPQHPDRVLRGPG